LIEMKSIIKAADRMDAVLYLITQEKLGNNLVHNRIVDTQNRLEAAWRDLPADRHVIDLTWQTKVLPSIKAHYTHGGRGV
jgi:hypothetical protein